MALRVTGTSAQGTVFHRLDAPGPVFLLASSARDGASATATRNAVYRTVPNEAGNVLSAAAPLTFQREYMSNGKLMVHASSWTIEDEKTITVPAGTFDCFVIVRRTRSLRSDWTGFERWRYSPQTQHYVRMEYKYGAEPSASRALLMRYAGPGLRRWRGPGGRAVDGAIPGCVETTPLTEADSKPQPQLGPGRHACRGEIGNCVGAAKPAARETGKRGDWHAQFGSSPDAPQSAAACAIAGQACQVAGIAQRRLAHDLGEKRDLLPRLGRLFSLTPLAAMALAKSRKSARPVAPYSRPRQCWQKPASRLP